MTAIKNSMTVGIVYADDGDPDAYVHVLLDAGNGANGLLITSEAARTYAATLLLFADEVERKNETGDAT